MDWAWIGGRIITATGWTYDVLNGQSACDIIELLEYWADEPPAHVTLALRYLGPGKRARPVDEGRARQDAAEMGQMFGQQTVALPAHWKELVLAAEQLKQQHKGL